VSCVRFVELHWFREPGWHDIPFTMANSRSSVRDKFEDDPALLELAVFFEILFVCILNE